MTKAELLSKHAEDNTEAAAQIIAHNFNNLELCVMLIQAEKLKDLLAQKYLGHKLTFFELRDAIKLASND